ncbi:MAG: damage-inducible protein DinB [Rhodobacteraceae bacterium]|nr:damage-inducible protein DinB [Paracoccaceae bacterium]
MISVGYCSLFARYNTWQNTSLFTAADGLEPNQRWADQGAFFKSIAATMNHLVWADALMLERLKGNERPQDTIAHSLTNPSDWETYKELRTRRDAEIEDWVSKLTDTALKGSVRWYPLDGSGRIEKPMAICIVQMFNHQTHHRGQIHAMLTAQGAQPEPTDIGLMS